MTSSTQFPTGTQASQDPGDPHRFDGVDANGFIGPVAIDVADHLVYFMTHHAEHKDSNNNTVITGEDALWYVTTNGGTNQTAIKVVDGVVEVISEGHWLRFNGAA